jgi:hypothetical protein
MKGTDWQFVALGAFYGSDTSDMLLRSSTGGFEVYDISNNLITNAAFLGSVGTNWQVMGFGDFSSPAAILPSFRTPDVLRTKPGWLLLKRLPTGSSRPPRYAPVQELFLLGPPL